MRAVELRDMAQGGLEAAVEVCLFVGPRDRYGVGPHARSQDGRAHGDQVRGLRQISYALEDVLRATEEGIRSLDPAADALGEEGVAVSTRLKPTPWEEVVAATVRPVTGGGASRLRAAGLAGEEAVGAYLGEGLLGRRLVAAVHDAGLELAEGLYGQDGAGVVF